MSTDVGTIRISLTANTASFDGPLAKSQQNAKNAAKGIQDSFNGIDLGDARAGLMVLDEELGIHIPRHVTALISQLPVLQTAFAAAFPLLAVVAVGKALADFVEKEDQHAAALAKSRAEVAQEAEAMRGQASAIEVSNLKLQDQINILTGKPAVNGPKILADEAREAAHKLIDEYQKAIDKIAEFATKNQQGLIMKALNGDDGSRELAGMVNSHEAAQAKIKADRMAAETEGNKEAVKAADAAMAAENATFDKYIDGRMQKIRDEVEARTKPHAQSAHDNDGNALPDVTVQESLAEATRQVNSARAQELGILGPLIVARQEYNKAAAGQAEGDRLKGQKDVLSAISQGVQLEDKAYNESKEVQQAKDRDLIASARQQVALGTMTADQLAKIEQDASEREYQAEKDHNEKLLTLEAANPALVRATNAKIEADAANHRAKMTEIATTGIEADNRELQKGVDELNRSYKAQEEQASKAAEFDQKQIQDKAKIALAQVDIATATAKQTTELQLASGYITQQQAAAQNLKTAQADTAAQLKIINDELDAQRERLIAIGKATDGGTMGTDAEIAQYRKALEAYQQAQNQKEEITKKTNAEIAAANKAAANNETAQLRKQLLDYQNIQKQTSQAAKQTFAQMNADLTQFITTGKADWRSLGQSAVTEIVKIGLQYLESKLLMTVADTSWGAAALAALGIHLAAHKAAMGSEAASSAAAAGANTLADVPFPENIPAAATVTGIGEGMAASAMSAAGGALLPNREAMVHTHPEEMILPRNISQHIIHSMNNSSGEGGGGDTLQIHNNVKTEFAGAREITQHIGKVSTSQMNKFKRQNRNRF
jgi:lambda family phage tail tape measure protein